MAHQPNQSKNKTKIKILPGSEVETADIALSIQPAPPSIPTSLLRCHTYHWYYIEEAKFCVRRNAIVGTG